MDRESSRILEISPWISLVQSIWADTAYHSLFINDRYQGPLNICSDQFTYFLFSEHAEGISRLLCI